MSVRAFIAWVGLWFCVATCMAGDRELWRDPKADAERRIDDLMSRLTLEEKVDLCHGNFTSGGVPRLGIRQLLMLDGRQGLRPVAEQRGTRTTLMPSVLALSCTWDERVAGEFGRVLAEEMLAMDRHVLLAPMLNLVRSPLGGRNFENFGEDPLLVGRMGAAYIRGVQGRKVGACACLLVANDCEHRRHFTSSNMDERTLRELHLLGYEMAVRDADVWSMMTGNNLYNGVYCAQNRYLVQDLIKDKIGFDGVMITDWRAAYDTVPTANAGTDMTTGFCSYVFGGGRLVAAVKAGEVSEATLNDKVRRVLRLYLRAGVIDAQSRTKGGLDTPEHRAAARSIAAQGIVLLKNEKQLLPLKVGQMKRVLVTGPAASTVIQGGGSGSVPAAVNVSPLDGLRNALGAGVQLTHVPFPAAIRPGMEAGSVEWEQNAPKRKKGKKASQPGPVKAPDLAALSQAAEGADAVLFFAAGTLASEGRDLPDMDLPGAQAQAIAALSKANSNMVVVLVNNGAVNVEPWIGSVPVLLAIHYAGQATGDAVADVLTGKVNPGGKLSYTFGKRLDDYACHAVGQWPARLILEKDPVNPGVTPEQRKATHAFSTDYKEGVFGGYRWFDEKRIEPVFPFGFGLSYSTFELGEMRLQQTPNGIRIRCNIRNTGKREGSEVVQIYVAPPETAIPRPPRELKGFAKVRLLPGESKEVDLALRPTAFAYFDVSSRKWKTEAGKYEILVGTSSRDIKLRSTVHIERDEYFDHF